MPLDWDTIDGLDADIATETPTWNLPKTATYGVPFQIGGSDSVRFGYNINVPSGGQLQFGIAALFTGSGGNLNFNVDYITASGFNNYPAPIPEPATELLLLFGLIGLFIGQHAFHR